MKSFLRFAAVFCLILVWAVPASATFIPLDNRAYRDIDALHVRGYRVVPTTLTRPYTRMQVARGIRELLGTADTMSSYEQQILHRLQEEFGPELDPEEHSWLLADVNPRVIAMAGQERIDQPRTFGLPATDTAPDDPVRSINTLDVSIRLTDNVSTGHRLEADTDGLDDHNYGGPLKTYRLGSTGQVEAAYVQFENSWLTATFGRVPVDWGPGRQGNLTLSDNASAFDAIWVDVHYRWLHFTSFTGQLKGYRAEDKQTVTRFMAGHRLVVTPKPWLEIGMCEAAVYGGPGRSWSLRWSNPMLLFLAEEVNKDNERDDNLHASGDVTLRPVRDVEVYGVFHMDDIALDKKSPDKIGWTLGGRWEAPFGFDRVGLDLEYTRVTRWVYNYANNDSYARYNNGRSVLGHFLGPDGDALFFTGRWESPSEWLVTVSATHRRRGDTRWDSTYPINEAGANFGYRHEDFPHGIVETSTSAAVQLGTPSWHGVQATASAMIWRIENADNVESEAEWTPGIRLDIDWHLGVRF